MSEEFTFVAFFRHHLWANLRLFDSCALFNEEQLVTTDAGAYGSIGSVAVDGYGKSWQVPKALLFAQVINHATEHRTNITTILMRLGLAELELSPWIYYFTEQVAEDI